MRTNTQTLIYIRPIPSTNNRYGASIHGKIYNLKTKRMLKPQRHRSGYHLVSMRVNGQKYQNTVHRLVAEAWLGACPQGKEVHHVNHDKTDNQASNLQYVTRKQNINEAAKAGMMHSKINLDHVHIIRNLLNSGYSIRKTVEYLNQEFDLNITRGVVEGIKYNNTWNHV